MMFKAVDRWVEKKILKRLAQKRQAILDAALQGFLARYPDEPTAELRTRMELEADRIYDFIGHSILKERLKRAKFYFWAVTFVTLAVAAGLFVATHAGAVIFISPAAAGIARWIVSVATIPISCNERVIGGMECVVNAWIRDLENNRDLAKKADSTREIIVELRAEVSQLRAELAAVKSSHFQPVVLYPERDGPVELKEIMGPQSAETDRSEQPLIKAMI